MQTTPHSIKRLALACLAVLPLLAACGGGGDAAEQPTAHLPPPCPVAAASAPCA